MKKKKKKKIKKKKKKIAVDGFVDPHVKSANSFFQKALRVLDLMF